MTSPVSPISTPAVFPVGPIGAPTPGAGTEDATRSDDGAQGFAGAIGQAVADGLNQVGALDQAVTEASQQAAVGNLESVSDFMIATAEAQLATEITVAVRDRAITAFNDIMRMQV